MEIDSLEANKKLSTMVQIEMKTWDETDMVVWHVIHQRLKLMSEHVTFPILVFNKSLSMPSMDCHPNFATANPPLIKGSSTDQLATLQFPICLQNLILAKALIKIP
ncbi:hypothetical protein M8C21_012366, partial [Ambrosia artemisiifolia]